MFDNKDDESAFFSANLKLAASYYPSVSALCRKIGINRSQFMKYLSGACYPSRPNLRRICDCFGVDEFELLMPPDQFRKVISLRPARENMLPPALGAIPKLLDQSPRQRTLLAKILGYYYEYYLSFSTRNHILRSLCVIYAQENYTLYKRIERLRHTNGAGPPDVYKYHGLVTVVGDRIYMCDQEAITGAELSSTILYTNYRNRVTRLTGLRMGVAGSELHEPSASRVVMEYIGRAVDRRQALSGCEIYRLHAPEIPPAVRDHLTASGRISSPLRAVTI